MPKTKDIDNITAPHEETIEEEKRPLRILLVDDDELVLTMVGAWLEDAGYEIHAVECGSKAIAALPLFHPHLVITDLRMEEMDGITLVKEIQHYNAVLPVIMLSGNAQISDAVRATHQGTFEFLTKPVDPEELFKSVHSALNYIGTVDEKPTETKFAPEIIHRSAIMTNLLAQAERVAKTRSSVFISGATGTGKELLAQAIHRASPRAENVFLAINCGALSEQLLESELFGHEKGAFTGAVRKNLGLFQAANEGSLFLDEIGDMPASLQIKLLRVLQEGQVKPVGAVNSVPVDVRIISATHHDLEAMVKRGEFREDLFYRLNVIPLHMPALTDRQEDIPLLIEYFLAKHAELEETDTLHFSPEAMAYMSSMAWPGNVRQLQNVIERCCVLSASPVIPLSLVQQAMQENTHKFQTLKEARNEFDHHYLNRVLRMVEGDTEYGAKIAGCDTEAFEKLLDKYAINPLKFRKIEEDKSSDDEDIRFH